jgi:putative colanic acid biosynthesis acetyltransferase WcaF
METKQEFGSRVKLKEFDATVGLERGAGKFKELCWYLIKISFFLSPIPYPSFFKVYLLKVFGAKIGSGVIIKPRVNIHFPWKLSIGNNAWIGEEVFLLNFERIVIGNNVCISQRAFLCGGNHDFRNPSMPYRNGPITLRDGCWIGACCFIGPGVTIGVDTVVTVGSVVTSNLEANIVCRKCPPEFSKARWNKVI